MNLVYEEILNLQKVRYFTPNERARITAEENDRAFVEWARKPLDPALPLFRTEPVQKAPLLKSLLGLIP